MWRRTGLIRGGVVLLLLMATSLWAYPITGSLYNADKIVPLPQVPYPDCTNRDSGSIDAFNYSQETPLDYVVVVENQWDPIRWKEFIWDIQPIITNPSNFWLELHIDFSITNPVWPTDPSQPRFLCEAFWNTGLFATGSLPPFNYRAVGWPGNNPNAPMALDPADIATANALIDWRLPENHPLGVDYYDWNPEWVSLEFYGWGFQLDYQFTDWCVPEPASLSLLALGALTLFRKKR